MIERPQLGRLELVDLRKAWVDEARNFTPWLCEEENISLLGEALGLQALTPIGREQAVGRFSADILAEDFRGNRVLIENQLAQSDHSHLGQCLTYAAGLDAKTIVWICSKIRDEHRAAIDWLNEISDEKYSFFAVEIELYRIGESDLAPKFNVAANPNDWTRDFRKIARLAESELTESQIAHRDYWQRLISQAEGRYPALGRRTPFKGNWQTAESLSLKSWLGVDVTATKSNIGLRAEIYFYMASAKLGFDFFKNTIDSENLLDGEDISWERMNDKATARIAIYRSITEAASALDETSELNWIIDTLIKLKTVAHDLMERLRLDPGPVDPKQLEID
ncbi:MAG TPA: DUF4268 domain-containing protein [Henriciella marina]|uniref:DUF4268 domain-containing protein n=1 Tax=Henriciella sp. TaxID=1968823 RepID=UPI00185269B3|nr:DUF4268 domain-containing protein [Henriciella sp.]HIG24223.1 DUF4268 domain-containing protein [Henriciella sp.]HIK65937.1 DUF4268 domain-containing protein [Henriciella marina]